MTLRVGSPVYSCASGLGILAKSFFDNGVISHPFLIGHAHHADNPEWYAPGTPGAHIRDLNRPDVRRRIEEWARGLDVLLAFETYFVPELVPFCRRHGVKVVLMPMYECHNNGTPEPDAYLCPSQLDLRVFGNFIPGCGGHGNGITFDYDYRHHPPKTAAVFWTPVPVAIEWRQRDRARVFVFNNGNGGLRGRNGLRELVSALEYVESPAKFLIRSQKDVPPSILLDIDAAHRRGRISVDLVQGGERYDDLWTEGDVFVFPEKWNGLSLPIQEARAAGMLVMAGARFPNTAYLPPEPLIPVKEYRRTRIGPAYPEFDEAVFDPRAIAATIDAWYDRDISDYSRSGREWAARMSWAALGPKYMNLLHELAGK